MRILYFDCFSGISGDMVLGGLIDLGLSLDFLKEALAKLPLKGYQLSAQEVTRASLRGVKFEVQVTESQQERSPAEIRQIINDSGLSPEVKAKASEMFDRLISIESTLHRVPPEKLHLHEMGAVDSLIDLIGALIGFQQLGIEEFVSSPLQVGRGWVRCQHGNLPVPAPATAELLRGIPVYSTGIEGELVTPTGALIISSLVKEFQPLPSMKVEKVGYGAGSRDYKEHPNLLRLFLGEREEATEVPGEKVLVIETNIDDTNPQILGYLMEVMLEKGALDVSYTPIMMKKNRPGTLLSVILPPHLKEEMAALIFRETTTLGIRYYITNRMTLMREYMSVDTEYGPITIKVARRGEEVLSYAPEYEECKRIAEERGVPLKEVQMSAIKSYLDNRERKKPKGKPPKTGN